MASEWVNDENLNEVEDEDIDIDESKLQENDNNEDGDNNANNANDATDTNNGSNDDDNDNDENEIEDDDVLDTSNIAEINEFLSFEPLEDLANNNNNNNINYSKSNSKTENKQSKTSSKHSKQSQNDFKHSADAEEDEEDTKTNINTNNNINKSTKSKVNAFNIEFDALTPSELKQDRSYRAIRVPGPRMIHIRRLWRSICDPIVTQLKLQIRMNSKKNLIEIRTSPHTTLNNAIQKGADFIKACVLGFEIKDSIALIRMDDIFLESFDIRDVKFFNKKSDHWMRAIGRIAGQYGKIKYSIENSTNTRIIIFGFKIHILGSFTSIRLARNAISRLVIGSAPGNVYAKLRVVSNRMKNRF